MTPVGSKMTAKMIHGGSVAQANMQQMAKNNPTIRKYMARKMLKQARARRGKRG